MNDKQYLCSQREAAGLTRSQLAREADTVPSVLRRLERGDVPCGRLALRIGAVLDRHTHH